MEKEYFVLHKKDYNAYNLRQNTRKRELYDRVKDFNNLDDAKMFAREYLHEQPILATYNLDFKDKERMKQGENNCLIALKFNHKYHHYDYGGGSDPVPTHEIERTNINELEGRLNVFTREKPDGVLIGLELKLFP